MTYNDKFLVEQWEAEAREKDRKEAVRWFFVLFICLLMLLGVTWFAGCAQAATLDRWSDNIRITEGINSNYPYGIILYGHISPFKARIICKRTVTHTFKDFVAQGHSPNDLKGFVEMLANRYCPYSVDPKGNVNWKRNMYKLMKGA